MATVDSTNVALPSTGELTSKLTRLALVPETEEKTVPAYSCAYCGQHSAACLASCSSCNLWFCNGRGHTSASHLVLHLVQAHHRSVTLHPESPLGETHLECYVCENDNVFDLGFIPATSDTVVVLLCRSRCAASPQSKDVVAWDLSKWQPLVEDKCFLSWLVRVPTDEEEMNNARQITFHQIQKLEELWKSNRNAQISDLDNSNVIATLEDEPDPVKSRYLDAQSYVDIFDPLVQMEADHDRRLKESQCYERLTVTWEVKERRRFASILLPRNDADSKLGFGDEVKLSHEQLRSGAWSSVGYVVQLPNNTRDEVIIELAPGPSCDKAPMDVALGFKLECVWKGTTYDRMRYALGRFAKQSKFSAMSDYLLHKILGHDIEPNGKVFLEHDDPLIDGAHDQDPDQQPRDDQASSAAFPSMEHSLNSNNEERPRTLLNKIKIPHFIRENQVKRLEVPHLPALNESQWQAVLRAISSPLSLIQGPPGTGKTVTSTSIVYHIHDLHPKEKILVCAPSNVAVDHLTEKIHATGLLVIRMCAKTREAVDTSVSFLTLHAQLEAYMTALLAEDEKKRKERNGKSLISDDLRRILTLVRQHGETTFNHKDQLTYHMWRRKTEKSLLMLADVVCCTCAVAGDARLNRMSFPTVLLDEATQATEPEALIPFVLGARQAILVGDHQQLGPVIMDIKAKRAGFAQSLFERLVALGNRPTRLAVQYRMHPCLSQFPSNMFYEGALQNGITELDRFKPSVQFPWPTSAARPMLFWAAMGNEELAASGTSYLNRSEASQCERAVSRLLRSGIQPNQIGIVTPYEGQRTYLSHYLQEYGGLNVETMMQMEIASVDAFQGREKDFIILSCVRSNEHQGIGFLNDPRRLNVALTRAKYGLIILGNPRALSKHPLWHFLLLHYKEHGCLVEGSLDSLRVYREKLSRPRQLHKYANYMTMMMMSGDQVVQNAEDDVMEDAQSFNKYRNPLASLFTDQSSLKVTQDYIRQSISSATRQRQPHMKHTQALKQEYHTAADATQRGGPSHSMRVIEDDMSDIYSQAGQASDVE